MQTQRTRRHLALGATTFLCVGILAGCGGGGDGGGSSASTPPSAQTSGLIPVAPVAGDVLENDAATLRVLRPGAVWTYHGVDRPYGTGSQPTIYTDAITHSTATVGVFEQATNLFSNGADTSKLQVAGGMVSAPDTIQPVSSVAADPIEGVELRSPVRANDQYTLYDRHFDDSGEDLDGDGVNDALDVAIWSRVIGAEVIDLSNRRQVQAVRVDTTLSERIRYSRLGTYSDIIEVVQRRWYAKGIGVVQMQLEQPGPNIPSVHRVTTEQLDTWNGLTEGVGYMPVQVGVVPDGESAGLAITTPIDAVAFDDHAVVMSYIPNFPMAEGISLTTLDLNGGVLSSTNQHGVAVASERFTPERLLRVGNELRVVVLVNDGLALLGFDASGQIQTLSRVIVIPYASLAGDGDGQWVQAAAVGNRIWLMWLSPNVDAQGNFATADLTLQQFDASGNRVGASTVLEPGVASGAIRAMELSAAPDRTIASWGLGTYSGSQRYAIADSASGTVLMVKTLTPIAPAGAGYPFYENLQPLALAPGLALVFNSDSMFGDLAGVGLDASFDPIRSSSGTLGNEVISPPWMLHRAFSAWLSASGFGHAFLGTAVDVKLWPDDPLTTRVAQLTELAPGGGALASTATLKLLSQVPNFYANFLLPYSDRVLLIGAGNSSLVSTAVWRQP